MKYKRGSFEFNICFLLSSKNDAQANEDSDLDFDQEVDEDAITRALYKLQSHLIEMELESDFLSCTPADAQPKSDQTCSHKLKKKNEVLEYTIRELFLNLVSPTVTSFILPLDELNSLQFHKRPVPVARDKQYDFKPEVPYLDVAPYLLDILQEFFDQQQNLLVLRILPFLLEARYTVP